MQSRVALAVRPRHKPKRQVNRASDIPGLMPDNDPFAARPPFSTRDPRWAAALYALSGTPLACGSVIPCGRTRRLTPDARAAVASPPISTGVETPKGGAA